MKSGLKLLISIGGGPEAYTALAFAAQLSRRQCGDVVFLTVREPDRTLGSGGMELRVAREQMLGWGLELPGLKRLKKARDIFAELGEISADSPGRWEHRSISGDQAGEYVVTYNTACGATLGLHLLSGTDIPGIVSDECERKDITLAIIGAPGDSPSGLKKLVSAPPMAYRIADRAGCPVIIARSLEAGHGILAVVDGSEHALECLPLLAWISDSTDAPLKVLSVAGVEAEKAARKALEQHVHSGLGDIGFLPPVEARSPVVLQAAEGMSLLAVPAPDGRLKGSLAGELAEKAPTSVMILR